jgi:hypothetical protein
MKIQLAQLARTSVLCGLVAAVPSAVTAQGGKKQAVPLVSLVGKSKADFAKALGKPKVDKTNGRYSICRYAVSPGSKRLVSAGFDSGKFVWLSLSYPKGSKWSGARLKDLGIPAGDFELDSDGTVLGAEVPEPYRVTWQVEPEAETYTLKLGK